MSLKDIIFERLFLGGQPTFISTANCSLVVSFAHRNKNDFAVLRNEATYVNGSFPHPATAVKSLGIKSLAGLTPKPAFIPKEVPSVMTMRPINNGAMFEPGPMFLLSNNAKMVPMKIAVARSCKKWKCQKNFLTIDSFFLLITRSHPSFFIDD